MVDTAIVRRHIVVVKEQALLYCSWLDLDNVHRMELILRRLKLVTGVDISTRAVNRSGSPGKDVKRRNRTAAAAPNRAAFLLSMLIFKYFRKNFNCCKLNNRHGVFECLSSRLILP
jgi:hypothetical protein